MKPNITPPDKLTYDELFAELIRLHDDPRCVPFTRVYDSLWAARLKALQDEHLDRLRALVVE